MKYLSITKLYHFLLLLNLLLGVYVIRYMFNKILLAIIVIATFTAIFITKRKIIFAKTNLAYLSFFTILTISITFSTIKYSYYPFNILYWLLISLVFFLETNFIRSDYATISKTIIVISTIHLFFMGWQFFNPLEFNNILKLLPPRAMDGAEEFGGSYHLTGITGQTGNTSLIISLGLATLTSNIISKKLTITNFVLFILHFIALLLTSKRGPLLGVVFSIITTYLCCHIKEKIQIKSVLKIFVISIIIPLLVFIIKDLPIFNKIGSSGRSKIWSNALSESENSIILGKGSLSYQAQYRIHPHNLYIQTLYENGIIGLILFFIIFSYPLWLTIKNVSIQKESYVWAMYIQFFCIIYGLTGYSIFLWDFNVIHFIAIAIPLKKVKNNIGLKKYE